MKTNWAMSRLVNTLGQQLLAVRLFILFNILVTHPALADHSTASSSGSSSSLHNGVEPEIVIDRSSSSGHGYVDQASRKMEKQFLYLLSAIAGKIDPAIATIKEDLAKSNLRAQSYGWALVVGGFGDSLADFVESNRMPTDVLTDPAVTYSYGYNIGYGFGFGGPFLLPTYLSDTNFGCSSQNFLGLVSKYGFNYGLSGKIGEAKVCNFGIDAKQALHCLLQHTGDYSDAAEIDYLIDDMVDAGVAVSRLRGH